LLERGYEYREYETSNVILNVFKNSNDTELLYYKTPFKHLIDTENLYDIEKSRMLGLNENGIYEPLNDDFNIQSLQKSIKCAVKRAKDSFYGYAKSNSWDYFVTLTFDKKIVDRYDDTAVKKLYSEFQRWCKRKNPDVKILIVPERHKRDKQHLQGAIHFHGFISNIDFALVPFADPKTGELKQTCTGALLYSLTEWKNGIATFAVLPKDGNYAAAVNYMNKYISKSDSTGYCQKRYYRTRNLDFKNKSVMYAKEFELNELVKELGLTQVKDNDKMIVFRKSAQQEETTEDKEYYDRQNEYKIFGQD